MGTRATLEDVARKAGVSLKTVSRVVNKEPYVSSRVRDVVELAIAELDYRPNSAARALASGRSYVVGLLSPPLGSSYFRRLTGEVIGACRKRGYHLVVEQLELDEQTYIAQVDRFIGEMPFDGLLLAPGAADAPKVIEILNAANIRFVAISPRERGGADLVVTGDEQQGERDLAEAFWSLGHRRFAFSQPPPWWRFTRGEAFTQQLLELGADADAIMCFPFDGQIPALEGGRRMASDILAARSRPTAWFCASDELAAGAIGLCLSRGVDVPGEISIAGFDDDDFAQATWPALTTIRQPVDAMIDRAFDLLVGTDRTASQAQVICPVELVMRDSIGPCRSG